MLRAGTKADHGSVELNFAAPLSKLFAPQLNGWLLVQYFNGHGESLVNYNRDLGAQYRVGLAIAF